MDTNTNTSNTRDASHLVNYQARTIKPMAAYALNSDKTRTVPGGALVTITEKTDRDTGQTEVTMTACMEGVYYFRHLKADRSQFVQL